MGESQGCLFEPSFNRSVKVLATDEVARSLPETARLAAVWLDATAGTRLLV